jgi:hypothetical protein
VFRHGLDEPLPRFNGCGEVALLLANISEVEIGRHGTRIDVDGVGKRARRGGRVTFARLRRTDLVTQEPENLYVVRPASRVDLGDLLADLQRLGPLMLILVQLLEVDQRIPVPGSSWSTS